jgi:hypothetical protein
MLDRITRPFVSYVNTRTPYKNLIERSDFYRRPVIRQITMIACAFLAMCGIVNQFSWKERRVVDLTRINDRTPMLVREVRHVDPLNTQSIKDIDRFDFTETVPAFMDKYTCVSPYKPCGYTEFMWGEIAQGPTEKDASEGRKYQGRVITSPDERRAIQNQRDREARSSVENFYERNTFDNRTKITDLRDGVLKEFRACHPQTIFEICQLNLHLITGASGLNVRALLSEPLDQSPLTIDLKNQLVRALDEGRTDEVARLFLELSEIRNSLPISLFEAAFGDIDGSYIGEARLPQTLKDMKALCEEFKIRPNRAGHSEQTIRNIISYYYHEGSNDPMAQARQTLNALPKDGRHYVIVDHQLMKADRLRVR